MEIQVEKKEKNYGLIHLKISQEDYLPEYNKEVKEYSKKAAIKGFRPGKVPVGLIKKMMGQEFKLNVVNKVVSNAIQNHLQDNNIETLLPPAYKGKFFSPSDFDAKNEFEMEFEFCYLPELKINLSELTVHDYQLEVSEEKHNEVLANIRSNYPDITEVDSVEKDDSLKVDISWVTLDEEGKALENIKENTFLPTNKLKEAAVSLFVGKKATEQIVAKPSDLFEDLTSVRFMLDKSKEEMENFDHELTITINSIERSSPAALNQAFFDKVLGEGKASTEEEFNAALREEVKKSNEPAINALISQEIFDVFTTESSHDFNDELLVRFLKDEAEADSDVEISQKRIDRFKKELNWQAASRSISKMGDIKITNQEVRTQAKKDLVEQLNRMGIPGLGDDYLDGFLDQWLSQDKGAKRDEAFNKVYSYKLVNFIKQSAKLETVKIDLEQLDEKLKAINKKMELEEVPEESAHS